MNLFLQSYCVIVGVLGILRVWTTPGANTFVLFMMWSTVFLMTPLMDTFKVEDFMKAMAFFHACCWLEIFFRLWTLRKAYNEEAARQRA